MQVQYHDKWLRTLGYPILGFVIRHFGELAPLGQLLKTSQYYLDLSWNILIVSLVWEANRRIILYLDRTYSWSQYRFKRFILQGSTAFFASCILVVTLIYLWNEVLTDHGEFDTAHLLVYDFPLAMVFTLLLHLIYTGLYFNSYYKTTIADLKKEISDLKQASAEICSEAEESIEPIAQRKQLLVVNHGLSSVPLATEDIAFIYKYNDLSFIKTLDGKEYTTSYSLDHLEGLLSTTDFFRFNRQMIGSLKSIRQFRSDSSGKLVLELAPPHNDEVTISKKRALAFKEWIGKPSKARKEPAAAEPKMLS